MADGFDITIKGLNEVGARLLAFSEAVSKKVIRDGANAAAEMFQGEATHNITNSLKKHRLKVRGVYRDINPGNLRDNIKIKTLNKMVNGQINVEVYVKKDHAWYGLFVERGTSKIAGIHFMARAFETHYAKVSNIFKERIIEAIRKGGL